MNIFFSIASSFDQFEVRNLLSVDAPIIGNLSLSLTNIGLYLTIAGYLIYLAILLATNSNNHVKIIKGDSTFKAPHDSDECSDKGTREVLVACVKPDEGRYYIVDKNRYNAWLLSRVRCPINHCSVSHDYFRKDGLLYRGIRINDSDSYRNIGFFISKDLANLLRIRISVFNGNKISSGFNLKKK